MIFYFTGTGNSLYVAKRLATKKDKLISIGEMAIADQNQFDITDETTLGFVMPVYFFGIPSTVNDFLLRLALIGSPKRLSMYTYLVLTCASRSGNASKQFAALLKKRNNFDLSANYVVKMPNNYIPLSSPPSPEEQHSILVAANHRIDEIANLIRARVAGDQDDCHGWFPGLMTSFAQKLYDKTRKTSEFSVNFRACVNCEICAKACPDGAIKMLGGRPTWTHPQCSLCLGCLNRCPKSAINFGTKTRNRPRYVNHAAGL